MSFTKHTKVEEAEILSPDEHEEIGDRLHGIDKTSAAELTVDERKIVFEGDED